MEEKYLVTTSMDLDGQWKASFETAEWILGFMDLRLCNNFEDIRVCRIQNGSCTPIDLHYSEDGQHLTLFGTDPDGNIVFKGYGTDH